MFRVRFKDDTDKQLYTVHCNNEDLDLRSHPYFVSLYRLMQPNHSPIIEIDSKEKQRFHDTQSLMIPVQNVVLIEKIEDEKPRISRVEPAASKKSPSVDSKQSKP